MVSSNYKRCFSTAPSLMHFPQSPGMAGNLHPVLAQTSSPWGWAIVDKEVGRPSTISTRGIKRLWGANKAGHAGTLDPLASGILPVALGQATSLIPWAMTFSKTYTFTITWGVQTSTDDSLGDIIAHNAVRPSFDAISSLLPTWVGTVDQVPPAFCAAKIQGVPAYSLARQGVDVSLAPRRVSIHRLAIIHHHPDHTALTMTCSTGTYVRSVARDLAIALGVYGHVSQLRRTQVGPFQQGYTLHQWTNASPEDRLQWLLSPAIVLQGLPRVNVTRAQTHALWHGCFIPIADLSKDHPEKMGETVACYADECLVALGCYSSEWLKPIRCFIGTS